MSDWEMKWYLREVALSLLDRGLSAEDVAEALFVPRQTVAAWRAHRTMGTY
jgi:hypothetical protein